jgi:protein gp37
MGQTTEIAWCDSTFNPWIGCQKVSAGCDNCYAETLMDKRYHRVQWGPHGERKRTSEANWKLPFRWARQAREALEDYEIGMLTLKPHRPRVFCASLADVFDNKAPKGARADLWGVIEDTPELDWLLLTKRPENILDMIPPKWDCGLPSNIWMGTTCEDQSAFDRRWPILSCVPARVRFISYEPAIGPLFIRHAPGLHWVICGGESGTSYRPMDHHWAAMVRNDCIRIGAAFFMKQMAGKRPIPADLLTRQYPKGVVL